MKKNYKKNLISGQINGRGRQKNTTNETVINKI